MTGMRSAATVGAKLVPPLGPGAGRDGATETLIGIAKGALRGCLAEAETGGYLEGTYDKRVRDYATTPTSACGLETVYGAKMSFLANPGLGSKLDISLYGRDDQVNEVLVLAVIQKAVASTAAGSETDALLCSCGSRRYGNATKDLPTLF